MTTDGLKFTGYGQRCNDLLPDRPEAPDQEPDSEDGQNVGKPVPCILKRNGCVFRQQPCERKERDTEEGKDSLTRSVAQDLDTAPSLLYEFSGSLLKVRHGSPSGSRSLSGQRRPITRRDPSAHEVDAILPHRAVRNADKMGAV